MKKDSAVSPVVGVMLMLVVTIILVGAVVVMATNVFEPVEKPISAELSYLKMTGDNNDFLFEMADGESFQMENLQVDYSIVEQGYSGSRYSPTLSGGTLDLGQRFTAGNLTELIIALTPDETEDYHIKYSFRDKKNGTLICSGIIPIKKVSP